MFCRLTWRTFPSLPPISVTSRLTAEFRQYLVEERHINPETISRSAEKKEMMRFIEDFNTATMPSDKYYNLEAHERRMAMIRAGETVDQEAGYDPLADEAAAKASFKAQRRVAEETSRIGTTQWQSKEQLEAVSGSKREEMGKVTLTDYVLPINTATSCANGKNRSGKDETDGTADECQHGYSHGWYRV